jgi:hypothetical protein
MSGRCPIVFSMSDNAMSFAGSESPPTAARVFISYRSKEPDSGLAQQFYELLKAAGHHVFLAGESRVGEAVAIVLK